VPGRQSGTMARDTVGKKTGATRPAPPTPRASLQGRRWGFVSSLLNLGQRRPVQIQLLLLRRGQPPLGGSLLPFHPTGAVARPEETWDHLLQLRQRRPLPVYVYLPCALQPM
jgi:hypothetical protein